MREAIPPVGQRYWELWTNKHIELEPLAKSWEDEDMEIVAAFKKRFPLVTRSVLDAGCGAGRFTPLFKPDQYLGIDNSPEMLAIARRWRPNYQFVEADIYNLSGFKDNQFELVLSHSVLKHLPEQEPALKEMWRVAEKYCMVTLVIGRKRSESTWKGFLHHIITFEDFTGDIKRLNPTPWRIDMHYLNPAHGMLVILYKQPPVDEQQLIDQRSERW